MEHQPLLAGFVRLHVLHHAAKQSVFGQWMIGELAQHGYRLSPGTLYPMLHAMERDGYLSSQIKNMGRTRRRVYRITRKGRSALKLAQARLRELIDEVG